VVLLRTRRTVRWLALFAGALALLAVPGCGDPPTNETEGSAERPEECSEPSALQISVGGAPVAFEASTSVANHVDESTWMIGIGNVEIDLGDASSLADLPAPPAEGTRVVIRLHQADGPLESDQTLTAADLGVAVSLATDGTEVPVTSLGAQATVSYVDDTNICGSIAVTDETATGGTQVSSPGVTIGGTFVATSS
jgi:hypothetical protein